MSKEKTQRKIKTCIICICYFLMAGIGVYTFFEGMPPKDILGIEIMLFVVLFVLIIILPPDDGGMTCA